MTTEYHHELTLDLGIFGEQEVTIHYDYSQGRPAVMYLRNGDPGYPEEPAELTVNRVSWGLRGDLPESWWNTPICLDVIIDELSAYHSED